MKTRSAKFLRSLTPKHFVLMGVFVLVGLSAVIAIQTARADGRILGNVSIGTVDVGGLTPEQAEARLREKLRIVNAAGFTFSYNEASMTMRADDAPRAESVVTYDVPGMVQQAFAYGHNGGFADLALANLRASVSNVLLQPKITIDREALRKALVTRFAGYETRRRDADVSVHAVANPAAPVDESASATPAAVTYHYEVDIIPEADGTTLNYDTAVDAAANAALQWQGANVSLSLQHDTAAITSDRANAMRDTVLGIMNRGALNLAYDDQKWPIDMPLLASAITLKERPDGTPYVGLRTQAFEKLFDSIADTAETRALPTKMTLLDSGKVDQDSFVGGQVGKALNRESTLSLLEERMADTTVEDVPVIMDTAYAEGSDSVAQDMGIQELLGYGVSNFGGSPKNRRGNIANGARLLGGTVIKPGEEFSLLNTLRPFDASNGYLPELVIKDKRTVPEFGGGLCQIGTTTFRATLGSGLPVTQRQNHSYRVVYYEPAGTDATIYDPAPDYRFVNDTGHSIVVITRAPTKDSLRFEFWGTRDGRVEKRSPVKITNVTQPPDPKLIETSELAEGKKKCFESAHPGATTDFTYTITYPDGHTKEKSFHSVYQPWQQQCLIGKADAPRIIIAKDGAITVLPPKPVVDASASPFATPAPTPST